MSYKLYAVKKEDGGFDFINSLTPKPGFHAVPEQYTLEDAPFLSAQEVEQPGSTEGVIERVIVYNLDTAAKEAEKTVRDATLEITEAYEEMNIEVYDKMYDVFETKKSDSASAYYETYKHMKDNAALYVSANLKVAKQIMNADGTELFDEGAALDTDTKIAAFATRKLELADEYAVWRMGRIQQFKDFKASKLGS